MEFNISPPWYRDPVERTAFNAYAYSQQKIEDFINALAASPDPNDWATQCELAEAANLNLVWQKGDCRCDYLTSGS